MSFTPIYVPPTVQVPINKNDPFSVPVAVTQPSAQFPRVVHPLAPLDSEPVSSLPISTNKFYTNLLLGKRTSPAYIEPYCVWQTNFNFFGLAVSSTDDSQLVFGPDPKASTARYFFEPIGIMSMVMSASEFTDTLSMAFHTQRCFDYSVQTYFANSLVRGQMWCPLVLGMGFVTAVYYNLTPVVASGVGFGSISEKQSPQSNMRKYILTLNNSVKWVMYLQVPANSGAVPEFHLSSDKSKVVASAKIQGTVVQVGRYFDNSDSFLDSAAGRYQTDAYVTASTKDNQASVRLQYVCQGTSNSGMPLMYVPPHYEGVLSNMSTKRTNFQLRGPSLGSMYGYVSGVLEFVETMPTTIGFLPYSQTSSKIVYLENGNGVSVLPDGLGSNETDEFSALGLVGKDVSPYISDGTLKYITEVATAELKQDINGQTNLDSMYYSGKALDKFAQIVFTAKYILNNNELALSGLAKLKVAFALFAENKQTNPLCYDTTWKGLISKGGLCDPNADFGNTFYNDHHFHYGYFVHAAAVIGQMDKDIGGNRWVAANKDFVNSLVRDVANPTLADPYFPRFRVFDFFAGHSWAKGLFESGDGKDEESSSEDYHFAYGMKLWGKVIGDYAMETRGNIMLAVMRHSVNSYMLFSDDNRIVPFRIVSNKVSGICFENKMDYATYFGTQPEYIHGIHMIPITSVSSYIRGPKFVEEEWKQKLEQVVPGLVSGWKGILYMNLALIDAKSSFKRFSQSDFLDAYLDGGMSRTWALAYAAYVGKM